jgi:uncharacterized protein YbjT (DUF2867 family)
MDKKAIIIGATGVVGSALVDCLAEAEHINKVITLTRKPVKHKSAKVVNKVVDFDNLDDYIELFQGDMLFSCLGTTIKQAGSVKEQRKVDVDYQLKAAQLAVNNNVEHYLLVSSSAANERSKNTYLKMKGELEQEIKLLPFKRISIFQPSLLLGNRAEFRLGEKIGSWIMKALCIFPFLKRYRPIKGEQVAAKMCRVSQLPGQTIEYYCLDEIFVR